MDLPPLPMAQPKEMPGMKPTHPSRCRNPWWWLGWVAAAFVIAGIPLLMLLGHFLA